jgi:hypothetical protein
MVRSKSVIFVIIRHSLASLFSSESNATNAANSPKIRRFTSETPKPDVWRFLTRVVALNANPRAQQKRRLCRCRLQVMKRLFHTRTQHLTVYAVTHTVSHFFEVVIQGDMLFSRRARGWVARAARNEAHEVRGVPSFSQEGWLCPNFKKVILNSVKRHSRDKLLKEKWVDRLTLQLEKERELAETIVSQVDEGDEMSEDWTQTANLISLWLMVKIAGKSYICDQIRRSLCIWSLGFWERRFGAAK